MGDAPVRIEAVADAERCRALEEIQAEVWGSRDSVVPAHHLCVVARFGGTLLVAYAGGEPVGFVYGFPALHRGRLVLHSHMLAVREAHRDRGIGRRLKLAQREEARRLGYPLVTWTFDPLECRNAYFNLHVLGARARAYYVNFYGEMRDALNRGLPSDRLLAEWETGLAGPAAAGADAAGNGQSARLRAQAPSAFTVAARGGLPAPGEPADLPPSPAELAAVRVPVPARIQAIKAADPELALAWRLAVRAAFQRFLGAGYVAVDLIPPDDRLRGVGYYVLQAAGEASAAP